MTSPPILYAAITLVIALICGLTPIFSKFKEDLDRLKILTGIAAGIIIAWRGNSRRLSPDVYSRGIGDRSCCT